MADEFKGLSFLFLAAIQFLESAGVKAFPALLNHLGDKTEASKYFAGEYVTRLKNGSSVPFVPTVGHACFSIRE